METGGCFLVTVEITLHFLPSTVSSSNSSPMVKSISVVRTGVEVLMWKRSPFCWISKWGLDAAATAIFLNMGFTPENTHRYSGPRLRGRRQILECPEGHLLTACLLGRLLVRLTVGHLVRGPRTSLMSDSRFRDRPWRCGG